MIDISTLSKQQILELEKQIQEYKKTEKFLDFYKVTFCVKFNPKNHYDSSLETPGCFEEWLEESFPEQIIDAFELKSPEGVSDFLVEKMSNDDKEIWGRFCYGWEMNDT